jgi:hypothetical protein
MAHRFTREQIANNAAKRERAAGTAKPLRNLGSALRDLIAAWDCEGRDTNVEYCLPCGSRLKIVCLATALGKASRADSRRSAPEDKESEHE